MSEKGDRARGAYTGCAVMWLNTTLLIMALNVLLGLYFFAGDTARAPKTPLEKYNIRDISKAYPDRPAAEVRELIRETWESPDGLEFDAATLFRPKARTGWYVNVDAAGFRRVKDQGSWPPDPKALNVFFFGGSTAFGMGVADDEAIPSRLQELCRGGGRPVRVYNFGVAGYFSAQERALFEKLLADGHKSDVAIFLDGLNEFQLWDGQPIFADRFAAIMAGKGDPAQHSSIPMLRFAQGLRARLSHQPPPGEKPHPPYDDEAANRAVCERWLANRKLIKAVCKGYGIKPLFAWQPVPGYKYDLRYHALCQGDPSFLGVNQRSRFGYAIMERLLGAGRDSGDMLWLADMQADRKENLYVDHWHYTARFSRDIAAAIAARLK